jgi:hypothetical protein
MTTAYPAKLQTPILKGNRMRERLKQWLRDWLGITRHDDHQRKEIAGVERKLDALSAQLLGDPNSLVPNWKNDVSRELKQLRDDVDSATQNLQEQITELKLPDAVSHAKPKETDDKVQIDPGFRRFSQRKRDYEQANRTPELTEVGRQIAENARLIASGTRQADVETKNPS